MNGIEEEWSLLRRTSVTVRPKSLFRDGACRRAFFNFDPSSVLCHLDRAVFLDFRR